MSPCKQRHGKHRRTGAAAVDAAMAACGQRAHRSSGHPGSLAIPPIGVMPQIAGGRRSGGIDTLPLRTTGARHQS